MRAFEENEVSKTWMNDFSGDLVTFLVSLLIVLLSHLEKG